ncbi:hypothetical protein CCACVL1_08385 [Corchorus capsularis]|uniref:Uncharacterized protein n=1 Tax=Corchorus capsularis TaxID=210143 RepID=A0A1R3J0V5_COCAP|nr:hypothetical protein CCACVL1_08385 [Corchorus capsularis]
MSQLKEGQAVLAQWRVAIERQNHQSALAAFSHVHYVELLHDFDH